MRQTGNLFILLFVITTFQFTAAQNSSTNNTNSNRTSITNRGSFCPENEEWTECGSHCPPHCPIYNPLTDQVENGTNVACILSCRQGCQCQRGFVRDRRQGNRCVRRERCTPINWNRDTCGPNQVFEECGTACPDLCPYRDPETGQLMSGSQPKMCTKQCVVGCACCCGFLRDPKQNGACVRREHCVDP